MAKIKLGKKDTSTATAGHVKGIKSGNSIGNYEKQTGHKADGKATAAKSTGINIGGREPIDPRMPNLPPA